MTAEQTALDQGKQLIETRTLPGSVLNLKSRFPQGRGRL